MGNRLRDALERGKFTVTAEIASLDTADPQAVLDAAALFDDAVDGINVVDASGAHCHMSSVAVSAILARAGYTPIFQMSCRDRNRIAMQGEILGAAALGVENVLCLTGDGVQCGDHPEAKPVFDMDSIHLLQTARTLRDKGTYLSGRELQKAPEKLFLGAAANPFAPPYNVRSRRLQKKVRAGADFIQTQYCYDVPRLRVFMQQVRDMGLHERVYILAGVGPLRSEKGALWMRKNVPGVWIPDELIERMRKTPKKQQKAEGIRICEEIIQQVREIDGIAGIHLMAYRMESVVPEILRSVGLYPSEDLRATRTA